MKKNLLLLSFVLLGFIGLNRYSAPIFLPFFRPLTLPLSVSFSDDFISKEHETFIAEQINDASVQHLSAHCLIVQLKKQFPLIKSVIIVFRPLIHKVKIELFEPVCSINDSFVLASNNELFSKAVFSDSAIAGVPAVIVDQDCMANAPTFLPRILSSLPSDFNTVYNLTLVNAHSLRFVDKNEPKFVIISSVDQKDYAALFSQCDLIKKNFSARGAFDRGMEWIADTRFAHYIVAYKA